MLCSCLYTNADLPPLEQKRKIRGGSPLPLVSKRHVGPPALDEFLFIAS